ncbi:AvrPphF family type III effector, partial [Pseudomonas coronafaciens]|uniref:AvrPphF family type III effector n=1 Tax=Pseudomonas coronafaciens TaxID=53409 RepID=UPI000F00508D
MGNNICGTSGSRHVYSPPGTPRTASVPSASTHIGENTLTSIYQLSDSERETFLDRYDPMRTKGLHSETELYRATDRCYIEDGTLAGNPRSMAKILLHEELAPHPFASYTGALPHQAGAYFPKRVPATYLGVPSLNVMVGSLAQDSIRSYARQGVDRVAVQMRLGDFLERGGKVYADDSSNADDAETSHALIVTLPRDAPINL